MVMKILQALELETKNVQEAGWIVVSVRYRVGRRLGKMWYLSGTGLVGGWVDCGICQVQGWQEAGWIVVSVRYGVGRRLGGLWYMSGTVLVGGWLYCGICQVQGW